MFALIDFYNMTIKATSHKISHLEQLMPPDVAATRTLVHNHYEYSDNSPSDFHIHHVPDTCAAFSLLSDFTTNTHKITPYESEQHMENVLDAQLHMVENDIIAQKQGSLEYQVMNGDKGLLCGTARYGSMF